MGTEVTIGGGGNSSVTPQDVIKKFMKSLDTTTYSGTAALNQAVSVASGGYFQNINAAITKMVEDCSLATSGTAFLQNYCDIVMYNDDTGAITGFDAGTTTIKTAQSVVPEIGVLDTSFNGSSFTTTNGLTFQLSNTNNLSNDELYMWRALKTWWADSSLNLINESYDYSFNDSDATFNTTRVVFEETSGDYLAATNGTTLYINKYYYYNFSDTDVDGISPLGQAYLDRVLSHELTHATMMAKIYGFWNLPEFITEGMAELTHGIDDTRSARINSLAGNSSRLETALSLNSGTGTADAYAGGYMFLRYFAKQASEHYPTVAVAFHLKHLPT